MCLCVTCSRFTVFLVLFPILAATRFFLIRQCITFCIEPFTQKHRAISHTLVVYFNKWFVAMRLECSPSRTFRKKKKCELNRIHSWNVTNQLECMKITEQHFSLREKQTLFSFYCCDLHFWYLNKPMVSNLHASRLRSKQTKGISASSEHKFFSCFHWMQQIEPAIISCSGMQNIESAKNDSCQYDFNSQFTFQILFSSVYFLSSMSHVQRMFWENTHRITSIWAKCMLQPME